MKRSLKFRLLHLVHNCVAHPALVVADVLLETKLDVVAKAIQKFHDATIPPEDVYNVQRFGNELLANMQKPEARARMRKAFNASPEELSRAAQEAAWKKN